MRLFDAVTDVRRKMGLILPIKGDIEWMCRNVVSENREVFDRLK